MSFISIKSEEKNLYKLLNQLRDEKLSVEMCENILSLTNAFQVTKAMLGKINKLDSEEKKEYKDVIVSMFDRRLQRDEEKNVALSIAKECSFEEELNEVIKKSTSFIETFPIMRTQRGTVYFFALLSPIMFCNPVMPL